MQIFINHHHDQVFSPLDEASLLKRGLIDRDCHRQSYMLKSMTGSVGSMSLRVGTPHDEGELQYSITNDGRAYDLKTSKQRVQLVFSTKVGEVRLSFIIEDVVSAFSSHLELDRIAFDVRLQVVVN